MAQCNWAVKDESWFITEKAAYYPNCNWKRKCECNKCEDNEDDCSSFFSSVSSSDQEAENEREGLY